MSNYIIGTVVNHQCVLCIGWSRYTTVEAVLSLGEVEKQYCG